MPDEPYDCPQKPFGGMKIIYGTPIAKMSYMLPRKNMEKHYAVSTNTDLYEYNVETGETKNLTERMKGYDINPLYSKNGVLAWLSMKRDGYEADKQDIVAFNGMGVVNLDRTPG